MTIFEPIMSKPQANSGYDNVQEHGAGLKKQALNNQEMNNT